MPIPPWISVKCHFLGQALVVTLAARLLLEAPSTMVTAEVAGDSGNLMPPLDCELPGGRDQGWPVRPWSICSP